MPIGALFLHDHTLAGVGCVFCLSILEKKY
nr:MAG TPA: hypothetical protein [Caudoviricetes sp.]